MKNRKLFPIIAILLIVSLSCNFLFPTTAKNNTNAPVVDFEAPAEPLNVTVQLDEASTTSSTITPSGGSLSLTAGDGTVFTLDVPAEALAADTLITMTAVKSIEGAPLDNNAPAAVQLEPSGLFFSEVLTLTIIPGQEIPIENQIIFGYESNGQDYHLALVDPKSSEIKIKLMEFSGAGVGSGGDAQWAANLQVEASASSTRLMDKFGEAAQVDRKTNLLEGDESSNTLGENVESILDQFYDQVVVKEMAAAELDCQYAQKAIDDLLRVERLRQNLLYTDGKVTIPDLAGKLAKLTKIRDGCKAAYRIVGGVDDWYTDTAVCDIMKPFTLTGGGITMKVSGGLSGTYTFTGPYNSHGGDSYGIMLPDGVGKPGTMTGGGTGCVETPKGTFCNDATEQYTLTPLDPGAGCTQ
ncbi:MAG TPA: hypothetical protein VFI68_02660 [Anaerolineales bacterium]|nr:hypothetical protein [Anaerolineales bacterium]